MPHAVLAASHLTPEQNDNTEKFAALSGIFRKSTSVQRGDVGKRTGGGGGVRGRGCGEGV